MTKSDWFDLFVRVDFKNVHSKVAENELPLFIPPF